MNIRTVVLAFLAARAPGAYAAPSIRVRCDRSGLCEASPSVEGVSQALAELASARMGALVDTVVDPVSKGVYWFATDAGVRQWTLDGRLAVEG